MKFLINIIIVSLIFLPSFSVAIDTLTSTKPLTINQTLVSKGDVYELGFINPANDGNLYIAIWYKNVEPKVYVWVANRDNPITSSNSTMLTIGNDGNIVLISNETVSPVWSSNQSVSVVNTVAQLLDDGNFVLRPETNNESYYIWQGFDYPTDTLLPGMKLGWTREDRIPTTVAITVEGSFAVLIILLLLLFYFKRNKMQGSMIDEKGPHKRSQDFVINVGNISVSKKDYAGQELGLCSFNRRTLAKATNNFSDTHKLGQGGFGCVYKGILKEGDVVAVKRLSKTSGQGIEELRNEVTSIAKLQHRNLVRLLGCCIEVKEKLLVYEYMENKSLNAFLFDKQNSAQLNWQKRFNIICGIARELLYLHQDSRLRIIHRDIKASNILLDKEMNPKISDFGMARIFWGDQTSTKTEKVVGTHGYMAPEYAMDGILSTKSDVYSFGVLVLEIVTGLKNRGLYYTSDQDNLLQRTWKSWNEGHLVELLDASIRAEFSNEVSRCIQIGLLCVQEHAKDRPHMSKVMLMLSGNNEAIMPQPKYPGSLSSSKRQDEASINEVTITILEGR